VATVVGVVIAGLWTWRVYVRNRIQYPRAEVKHRVTVLPLSQTRSVVRIDVTVKNISEVLVSLVSGCVRLSRMLPAPSGWLEVENEQPLLLTGTEEFCWPKLCSRNFDWHNEPREVEPGESDTFQFDFLIDGVFEKLQIYSHLTNVVKRKKEIGWNTTSIHSCQIAKEDRNAPIDRDCRVSGS